MRRKHSKLRMGFRGRSGFLLYGVLGTAVVVVIYYAWSNFFSSPSRISYSSVQGLEPGQMEQWSQDRQKGFVEAPPIGLNKEIEQQMANENANAAQDNIDEERIAQERAAQAHGKSIDSILKEKAIPQEENKNQASAGEHPLLFMQADPRDEGYFNKLERIVHLDLKGAPPLVSYLENLFPLLKRMGATGLLMEYEDMFPYSGNLSVLASGSAYSMSDLQRIQAAAKLSNLKIIPLVQTFGHMEFVLKHTQFRSLREQDYTPQVISPVKDDSYTLIFNMLDQVLKAHPDARMIHLGCDEVYELGKGESSKYLVSNKQNPGWLYLQHVVKVAKHVKTTFPAVQSLIWDDWLRRIQYEDLANSNLGSYVEPVVWYYQHDIRQRISADKWTDYGNLFNGVWVASAFKGATGSAQILTNASVHLDNNLQWISIIREYGQQQKKNIPFRGMMLTGWQRYDHFATLCELLPVGLPSLSLSMQAVKNGGFGPKEMEKAGHLLECSRPLDLAFPAMESHGAAVSQDCRFPGSDVLYEVQQLWGIMEGYRRDVGLQERITGWLTDFHVRRAISSPGQMKILAHKLEKVLQKLENLSGIMQNSLLQIYDHWTTEEWIATNIQDRSNHIKELWNKARNFLEPKVWPARPFPDVTTKALTGMKDQPSAVQMFAQTGLNLLGQQNPPQGPQSISGRGQISGGVQNPNVMNNANAYIGPENARFVPQGAGLGQNQNSAGYGRVQGGKLSQMLLKQTDQGLQGQPSGPSKMQGVNQNGLGPYPGNRQGQQPVNFQVVPGQSARGQQQLGQYMAGLPQTPLPLAQNMYHRKQNLQEPGAGQYPAQNQQHSALAQHVQNQGDIYQGWNGLGQNVQGANPVQQQFVRKTQSEQVGFQHKGLLQVQGPQKMEHQPVNPQQAPSVSNQRERLAKDNSVVDTSRGQKPQPSAQLFARDIRNPDAPHNDVKQAGKDTVLLDSFIGWRGKNENELDKVNGNHEEKAERKDRMKMEDNYNDEEDNENA